MDASTVIEQLGLEPHPEGGFFAETYRDPSPSEGRSHSTAIYYLLREGERSHWHRIDAAEVWHHYAGEPLELRVSRNGRDSEVFILGRDLDAGQRPQEVVPAGAWQSARSRGEWSLMGCTVAPAFKFETFELAPEGWTPGQGPPDPTG